jgi:SAM-dependent methyltransferase
MARQKDDEWFQDEAFWDRFAPIMFDEQRWAEVPAVADGIEAIYRSAAGAGKNGSAGTGQQVAGQHDAGPHGGADDTGAAPSGNRAAPVSSKNGLAILDQCCGLGRLSVELALRGHRLTGIDITPSYLEAARESAEDEGLSIEFIQIDVRRFVRPDFYNLVLNLYTSFGYFADASDDRQVVANAYESLVPGGLYIIETLGKEIAVRDFTEGEWFERAGAVVLTDFEPVNEWEYLNNRWILLQGGERFERTFMQRLYAATELRRLMLDVGFTAVTVYGDWDRRPYDYRAIKLIVVGKK